MLARPENMPTNCSKFKSHSNNSTRYRFFAERVVSVWNSLPTSVNLSTLGSFIYIFIHYIMVAQQKKKLIKKLNNLTKVG